MKTRLKKTLSRFKTSFVYNFFSCGLGWLVVVIIATLWIFHDFSCNRLVQMKEDILYIKPMDTTKDD